MEIGATYLKIPLYNGMLLEAEGIIFRFANTAVNRITNKAAPNFLPNLVLPAYTAKITIKHNISKT